MHTTVATAQSFWDELAAAIAERRPRVFRQPFGATVVSPEEAFSWAVAAADNTRAGDRRSRIRLYAEDGHELAPKHELLPRAEDGTFAAYAKRLDAAAGGDSGLVVNNLQAASGAVFMWVREQLRELLPRIGRPAGGVSCEIFAGGYRRGAFGVHKDDQDVITFVVEGTKRFMLWPYAVFAEHPETMPGSELRPVTLSRFDEAPFEAAGELIEGRPGDVFYWPAEQWHVARNDGQQCTTVSLGISQDITLGQLFEDALREEPAGTDASRALRLLPDDGDVLGRMARILADADVRERFEARVTAMRSGWCCKALPEPRADVLADDAVVRGYPGALLLRLDATTVQWSVHGASYTYPRRRAFERLFAAVTEGAPFVVGELAHELADLEVDASALRHTLAVLYRNYALVEATPA